MSETKQAVEAEAAARSYGRTAGLLSIGVGATGLVTYLYFALASHNLSRQDYGEIAVLWSAVFITISVLYRPVEQLLSRTIAERESHGQPIGHAMRIAATIQFAMSLAFAAIALLLRGPIQNDLLSGNEALYWVMVVAVLAYGVSYFARGFLAGSRRLPLYALLILSESLSRTLFAVLAVVGVTSGQSAIALGIAVAPIMSLIAVPLAFTRFATRTIEPADESGKSSGEGEFTLAHGSGFAAAVLLIMISEQTFLNAGPLLVKGQEGAAAAGYIFNVLMIARAPLQLFQAVSTSLLPHLTGLRAEGAAGREAFRRSVAVTINAIAAIATACGVAMLIAGPKLMQIAFGDNFTYDRPGLLIVTAGMGLYLSAATLNQAALAQGQAKRASICWITCAAGFLVWNLMPALSEVRRVEWGFLGAAIVLCTLLYVLYRRGLAHPGEATPIQPGSPEELEAQLAAGDEAG